MKARRIRLRLPLAVLAVVVSFSMFVGAGVAAAATPSDRSSAATTAASSGAHRNAQVDGLSAATFERAAPYVQLSSGQLVLASTVRNAIGSADAAKLASLVGQVNWEIQLGATGTAGYRALNTSALEDIAPYGWWQDLVCAGAIVGAIAALAGLIWFVTVITGTWDLWYAVALIMGAGSWSERVQFLTGLGVSFSAATGVAAAC